MDQLSEGKQLYNVLEHAERHCSCESYYNYKCPKCLSSGRGFLDKHPVGYQRAEEEKLVEWNSYHGLVLTDAGKRMYKQLQGDYT